MITKFYCLIYSPAFQAMQKSVFLKYYSLLTELPLDLFKYLSISHYLCYSVVSFLPRLGLASNMATPFLQPVVAPKAL